MGASMDIVAGKNGSFFAVKGYVGEDIKSSLANITFADYGRYNADETMKKISQSGRSMMEMLGVLAVVGVLSVGGFAMVSKMQASYEANKVMDEISAFVHFSHCQHPLFC